MTTDTPSRRPSPWTARLRRHVRSAPWSVASSGMIGLLLLGLFSCVGPPPGPSPYADHSGQPSIGLEPWIRVLLVESKGSAKLAIDGPVSVHAADPMSGRASSHGSTATLDGFEELEVRAEGSRVIIEGQAAFEGAVVLRPQRDGAFRVNGRRYRGELTLKPHSGALNIVNELPLEDYLCGVIGREMPLSFPAAALDAQAVAARSYALWHLRRSSETRDHDVKNDTRSQVYGGADAEDKRARATIERTRGLIARCQGRPFQTYFHSTCGGATIPAHWVFGGAAQPGLGGADCGQCTSSKYYRWTKVVEREQWIAAMRTRGYSLVDPVTEIRSEPWGRGGYQKRVLVDHGGGQLALPAPRFRTVLGLRNSAFVLRATDDELVIEGRGWGHGVGMCQVGARGYARQGLSGNEIIEHYYPGAKVDKVY